MTYSLMNLPSIPEVLEDETAHTWLKQALRTALECDPMDVARDAHFLYMLLEQRQHEYIDRELF